MAPLNLVSPRQFQAVTKKKSQSVDFLPEPPFISVRVSPQITQPGFNRLDGMFLESRIGMFVNENLNMPSIPGNRPLGDTKELQYITVPAPEDLNSGVFGWFSVFHETSRSMRIHTIENIYRTIGGIIQYWRRRYNTIIRAGNIITC